MRRTGLIPLFALTVVVAAPASLGAQWTRTIEGGASHLKQPGLPEGTVFTLGGTAESSTRSTFLRLSALGARGDDDRSTGQAVAIGSVASPAWHSWMLQGTGTASWFGQTNLRPTTGVDGLAQARTGSDRLGFALGGGIGHLSHNAVWIAESRAVADGWASIGSERLGAEVSITRSPATFGESSILVDVSNNEVNYLDLAAQWRHERDGWSLSASGGVRGRDGLDALTGWGTAEAAAWVRPNAAIVLSAGRTLVDFVRGVPQTSFASVALRFSSDRHPIAFRRPPPGPHMSVARYTESMRQIRVSGVSAARVELMADFTGWSPVVLERDGNGWRLDRDIPPGPHRVAIRFDGGEWTVPVNLPRVDDDLGGIVGLITVP